MSGRIAESNNDWATAVKEFSRAIELNPNLSLAYERRSNAYAGLKEEDQALSDLNKAIELDPKQRFGIFGQRKLSEQTKKNTRRQSRILPKPNKLKETCAKTYRGILFTTLANANKEAPNTENFLNAQRDFLADDAQKCYLTHYMYGLSFYAQGLNSQAAQQFEYALTVYKKHGYTTEKIIEFSK